MRPIPEEVMRELLNQQAAMDWPEKVPAFVDLPGADGRELYYRYQETTIALCEQGVEYHARRARGLLSSGRYSRRKATAAARHILMARILRCRYIELTGQNDSTEDDMPFAQNQW